MYQFHVSVFSVVFATRLHRDFGQDTPSPSAMTVCSISVNSTKNREMSGNVWFCLVLRFSHPRRVLPYAFAERRFCTGRKGDSMAFHQVVRSRSRTAWERAEISTLNMFGLPVETPSDGQQAARCGQYAEGRR